jgi:hypothetical protein
MAPNDERTDRELADLAALADGTLPPEKRAALEQRVAASPRLQALLREQRAALEAVRTLDQRAPRHLRESIASARAKPRAGLRLPRLRAVIGAAVAAAAIAVLVVLALPSSETSAPTLAQVAALAARRPAADVPAGHVAAWGLEYPDLAHSRGWRTAGSRADHLGRRTARTVFYTKGRRRIAYTIVATGLVQVPDAIHSWRREGRPWYAFRQDGRTVVAWERKGHMCVVSASGLDGRALVELITR